MATLMQQAGPVRTEWIRVTRSTQLQDAHGNRWMVDEGDEIEVTPIAAARLCDDRNPQAIRIAGPSLPKASTR